LCLRAERFLDTIGTNKEAGDANAFIECLARLPSSLLSLIIGPGNNPDLQIPCFNGVFLFIIRSSMKRRLRKPVIMFEKEPSGK
jgi:hypothetical protein